MTLPDLPPEAKPHEIAVLLAYSLGLHEPTKISNFLHYESNDTVYNVFRRYRKLLPTFRTVGPSQRFAGKAFILPRQ